MSYKMAFRWAKNVYVLVFIVFVLSEVKAGFLSVSFNIILNVLVCVLSISKGILNVVVYSVGCAL